MKLGSPDDLMGKFGALDQTVSYMQLYSSLSNLWAPNFNCEILDVIQAEKEYTGP